MSQMLCQLFPPLKIAKKRCHNKLKKLSGRSLQTKVKESYLASDFLNGYPIISLEEAMQLNDNIIFLKITDSFQFSQHTVDQLEI